MDTAGSLGWTISKHPAGKREFQRVTTSEHGRIHTVLLPAPTALIWPGVRWGRFDTPFTPAFWRAQVWFEEISMAAPGTYRPATFALGRTLAEELAACLLGGYGLPAEVGLAAYARVRDAGLLQAQSISARRLQRVLELPLEVNGRVVRYRFPAQRSRYLAAALTMLACSSAPREQARDLRDWLLQLPGIGYKTASWITRNHLGSDEVAIIDVHIHRAGLQLGIFSPHQRVACDYLEMEQRFLAFSRALGVSAAMLDAVMWREMRSTCGNARREVVKSTTRRCSGHQSRGHRRCSVVSTC